jgi:hypothetical protein
MIQKYLVRFAYPNQTTLTLCYEGTDDNHNANQLTSNGALPRPERQSETDYFGKVIAAKKSIQQSAPSSFHSTPRIVTMEFCQMEYAEAPCERWSLLLWR